MDNKKKDWPIYFKERLWTGNLENGYIGIATLWTPKERVIELIDEELKNKVAVVGQFYSKTGAEYIFKNVWANPKIRYIIIWGADLTGSGNVLIGNEKQKNLESLLENVLVEDIKEFFDKVEIIDMRDKSLEEVIEKAKNLKYKPEFSKEIKLFAENEAKNEKFVSENSVFRVEGKTVGEGWLQILKLICRFGRQVPRIFVYGGNERVLLNVAAVITDEDIKDPKMWPFFDFDKENLKGYFKNFFTPERGEEAYTYGERLFAYEVDGKKVDQITEMAKKLQSFPYNKGALAVLWQAGIDNFPIRNPWRTPCLTLIQGFCLEDKFYLTAYFRSNDMFAAWPQNAFALRKLQAEIANKIGKKTGDLTVISSCAFIDENDLKRAEKIIENNQKLFCRFDPRGNLVIEVVEEEIIVKHFSMENKLLAEYKQNGKEENAARKMSDLLLINETISRVDHALDIGQQLARAEEAIKLGLKFEQDKGLK